MIKEKIDSVVTSNPYRIFVIFLCLYSLYSFLKRLANHNSVWGNSWDIANLAFYSYLLWINLRVLFDSIAPTSKIVLSNYKIAKLTNFLYSTKTQREIFQPILADWEDEYFESLYKKEIWKARWINVRYTYAFLMAMWMKSPIGDLIEFIKKIAKP